MVASDEAAIRAAHQLGDMAEVVRLALGRYQVEVYLFLCARLGNESDAHEVFSQLSEDLWRGIDRFAWRSSLRTWLYTLARHAAIRFERSPANQSRRHKPISRVTDPVAIERSRTRPYLRTDVKDRFAALRATLSPDEQSLIVLRIDRGLSWEEVARVFHDGDDDGDGDGDDDSLKRRTANLRQRFRQLKERLRERARADGLLDDDA
jgi:RNA polymerase sigma-70 factor (ECF subfamily)